MRESTSSTTVTPGDRGPGELTPVPDTHRVLRLVLFALALVATMVGAAALPVWLLP